MDSLCCPLLRQPSVMLQTPRWPPDSLARSLTHSHAVPSPPAEQRHPVTRRSHHGRGGHVGVTRHQGAIAGSQIVARRPGSVGRRRTARGRHGCSRSRGRKRGVGQRVGGMGCCRSSGETLESPTASRTSCEKTQLNLLPVLQEWVPIIRCDMMTQRKMKAQPPLSDAYLHGMPAKRRKVIGS